MSQRSNRSTLTVALAPFLATLSPLSQADTPQALAAKIDGKPFESDDDGILFLYPTVAEGRFKAEDRQKYARP